jgi:hypothetical protein
VPRWLAQSHGAAMCRDGPIPDHAPQRRSII